MEEEDYWDLRRLQHQSKKDPSIQRPKLPKQEKVRQAISNEIRTPPDKIGRYKGKGIFDWSIDELIAYKETGKQPQRVLDTDVLHKLGKAGVSMANVCAIFQVEPARILENVSY